MQLHEVISQISDIHDHMAQSQVYRGYRSLTTGFSGAVAGLGAVAQPFFVHSPTDQLGRYLILWIAVAAISALITGCEIAWRARATESALVRQMSRLAFEQLSPSLFVGALVTLCIYGAAPQAAWMLPGLWALIFGLGIFALFRLLPNRIFYVALYYTVCGLGCLVWGQGDNAFSAWLMGVSFGGGQIITAFILYWNLERNHGAR